MHLFDLGVVELLNATQGADIFGCEEVDGNPLTTETTTATDAASVGFTVGWQVVAD